MPAYGVSAAGFAAKPLSQIQADIAQRIWDTVNPTLDLSPATPDGQILGIYAADAASNWEILQVCYNEYNREDAEGAALDNIGDITGTPREGPTYTQVYCNLGLDPADAPYNAGTLTANVVGDASQTYTNLATVTSGMISGGMALGVLFQATTIGTVPTVNAGTLTVIATPVTGWSSITNPAQGPGLASGQSVTGTEAELDPAYMLRQAQDVAGQGDCTASALAAKLNELGAAQQPPQTLLAVVLENVTNITQVVEGVTMPAHTYAPIVYDAGTGWASSAAGQAAIAAVVYANKPAGITSIGSIPVIVQDAVLGPQTVYYSVPTPEPLFIIATVVFRPGSSPSNVTAAIQSALVAAAVAPTSSTGVPPLGQLAPGSPVVGSQLEAVIMAVPGVFDVQYLAFDFHVGPTNQLPLIVPATSIATIASGTVATHVIISPGTYP